MTAALLAEVVRSGFVEGVHRGSVVVLGPDGQLVVERGDPEALVFPRSSNKPLQASGMVRAGLRLEPRLLALAAASHSGEEFHLAGVRAVLAGAGLTPSALRTPPDLPVGVEEQRAWIRADRAPEPLAMNCSGKHAAMLATCVLNGWPVESYLDPAHPLQAALADEISRLSGEPIAATGVDGCGAPLYALSLTGLARAFRALALGGPGTPEHRVAAAMRDHPDYVGGTGRDVTALMAGVPGLIAKDGAEAVYAAALPDGTAIALKVDDGGQRARPLVMAAALRAVGVTGAVLQEQSELVLLGGGRPVGVVRVPTGLFDPISA